MLNKTTITETTVTENEIRVPEKDHICRLFSVNHLLGSTPFLVGEYTISCWGVHHFLLGSTPFLVGEYTISCWGVHHFLLGSTPLL
ncbi:Hypothetical Protein RradSPS_3114 (plasmid) [Rubrobacter radiotolerans]|uniref:Uncharacterized protein n=1 Tax=Rubrobacter radiotolerans TaxID=42256 RepID=A0A023X7I9_RUBRA|nr:Hypothetical Protein RradSPS_3114 [Rubrobacter radiotolerans]